MNEIMGQPLFVGVDSGATKTHVMVVDENAEWVSEAQGPAANLRLSAPKAWEVIQAAVAQALQPTHTPRARVHLGIGVSGTELTSESDEFIALIHGYASVQVESDAYTACLGAHGLKDGAIIVVGTGVAGYRIVQGVSSRVGGWGFPHDDCGSGAWLGLEAVRAALGALDGRSQASALTEALAQRFNTVHALSEWACAASAMDFATLAREVVAQAQAGDELALDLLRSGGAELSRIADALFEHTAPDFSLALVGGLAPTMENFVSKTIQKRLRQPRYNAAEGAALMIREHWLQQQGQT